MVYDEWLLQKKQYYHHAQHTVGWDSIEQCRAVTKVTMMNHITNKLVDIPDNQLILKKEKPTDDGAKTRGIIKKFHVPSSRTNLMKGSFFSNTIRLWNKLPQHVVDSPTLDIFKTRVCDVRFS